MKTIIILGDGMSDYPIETLNGKTPLQAANKPNIDRIAREGRMGLFETLPEGLPKGSEVANLSVLGYDPVKPTTAARCSRPRTWGWRSTTTMWRFA